MIASESPEWVISPDERGNLCLICQDVQPGVAAWKDEDRSAGSLALQGNHPTGDYRSSLQGRFLLLGVTTLGDQLGHLGRGWRFEQGAWRQVDANPLAEPRYRGCDAQRTPSQFEEVIVRPDRTQVEDLYPCRL